jgi:hypothetical protein
MGSEVSAGKANELFNELADLIVDRNRGMGFVVRNGAATRHDVVAAEFMLMEANDTRVHFKHRDTRNYVIMNRSWPDEAWKLHIPSTGNSFMKGFFDKF